MTLFSRLFVKQLVKYCVVGASGVIINSVVLYVFTEYGHFWYMLSNLAGIGVAMFSNFVMNREWTFKRTRA